MRTEGDLPDEEGCDDAEASPWYEGLSDQHRRFVEEYCVDFNQTKAAIRAGYSNNEDTAAVTGHRLLRNAKIVAAKDEYLAGLSMSSAEAVHKLSQWGRGSLAPFMETGNINLSLPNALAHLHLLKEVDQTITTRQTEDSVVETVRTKIKIHDPMAAVGKILEVNGKLVHRVGNPDGSALGLGFYALLKESSITPDDNTPR